jgi:hypothetical protein
VAKVTNLQGETVSYEYVANGRRYTADRQLLPPNPDSTKSLALGDDVKAWYDAEAPEDSVLGDPSIELFNESCGIICSSIAVPTFFILNYLYTQRRKQAG